MSSSGDLEFVATTDLLAEIMRRHDHAVFVGMQVISEHEGKCSQSLIRHTKGCKTTCIGLAMFAGHGCLEVLADQCRENLLDGSDEDEED